jgi:hypothetical protein
MSHLSPKAREKRHELEQELRRLSAWYEWSDYPNPAAAQALQDAADALVCHALSLEAAKAIADAWQPHAGVEALVGNMPPVVAKPDDRLDAIRIAVRDLGQKLAAAKTSGRRAFLARLFNEQIAIYERATRAVAA